MNCFYPQMKTLLYPYLLTFIFFIQGFQLNSDNSENLDIIDYHHQDCVLEKGSLLEQLHRYWDCQENAAEAPSGTKKGEFCQQFFDGLTCWNATRAGHQTSFPCPSISPHIRPPGKVFTNCTKNAQWEKDELDQVVVNYSACSIDLRQCRESNTRLFQLIADFAEVKSSPYKDVNIKPIYIECIEKLEETVPLTGEYCAGTFDGWSCWNDTPAGEIAYASCPDFIFGFVKGKIAYKICNEDGNWYRHPDTNKTWSNYTTCIDHEDLMFRKKIIKLYIAGYSVSLIALLISLAIFFYFPSLQCIRITIHKNLFISFILHNIMWIIWYTEVVRHVEVLRANSTGCQMLHIIVHYFLLCNYFWMFCEGLHLHTLMVFAFVQESKILKWFCVIGWVFPLILITIYSSVRVSLPGEAVHCWIADSPCHWIIQVPVCVSMLLNFIFLVNIVRVLVTKLRAVNSPETHQTKKAVRATLILLPLLGLHYLLTPFRPDPGTQGEAIYETIATIVTSFQGLCVALLFCFFNGEVVSLWKKKWMRFRINRGKDMRVSYAATTLSFLLSSFISHGRDKTEDNEVSCPISSQVKSSEC